MALLELTGVTKRFGGLTAVDNVNLVLNEGEILGLIGPNGAGKTTLFAIIAGYLKPNEGKIVFNGVDITGKETHKIARMGMNRTFQVVKPFSDMNVVENVMVGAMMRNASVKRAREKAMDALEFCGLAHRADYLGRELTVANKKRLEVARALASDPKVLLLDEVMAGLNPSEVRDAVEFIHRIHARGVTLLVIEHVMEVIMPISHRVAVLNYGKKIVDSDPKQAVSDPEVISAYFGSTDEGRGDASC
ncbi:MAG: ABC transporter ATP-binding protein [Clostridiales bacterium]|nr:ABC transporter ATP-binding protein [Clostridiales bacterium]